MVETVPPRHLWARIESSLHAFYCWLLEVNAFSSLVGAVLVSVALPLALWAWQKGEERRDQRSIDVCINVPHELKDAVFELRHVRNGPGSPKSAERMFLEDKVFPPPTTTTTTQRGLQFRTCLALAFPHGYGVQFKPFVDYSGKDFGEVKRVLESAEFLEVSKDSNPMVKKAWFLLSQFQITSDGPDIKNNYYNE
jgi:hypothetical protein